jgi:hypothetical protein
MPYLDRLRTMGIFGPRSVGGRIITADYGGHAAACGFHNVDPQRLLAAAATITVPTALVGAVLVDGTVALSSLTPRLAREMDMLAPFGIANSEPRLLIPGVTTSEVRASRTGQTLLFSVSDGRTSHHAFWYGHGNMAGTGGLPAVADVLVNPIPNDAGGIDLQVIAARKVAARA